MSNGRHPSKAERERLEADAIEEAAVADDWHERKQAAKRKLKEDIVLYRRASKRPMDLKQRIKDRDAEKNLKPRAPILVDPIQKAVMQEKASIERYERRKKLGEMGIVNGRQYSPVTWPRKERKKVK